MGHLKVSKHKLLNARLVILFVFGVFFAPAQTGIGIYKIFPIEAPGFYYEYYPSGKLKVEGVYLRLDSISCINCYNPFTEKLSSKSNINLMRVGEWKEFYENGSVKARGYYKNVHEVHRVDWPMPYGESSNGLVPGGVEVIYLKEGYWLYYNEKGNVVQEEFYFQGMLAAQDSFTPARK